ncbi:uncharacterized protein PV07_12627 [Cladophialophora immunda]|uniref:Uncharacterized protein n=1 Tax=Cladophialophora immunda TaxID=569365 RepID=A0A0D2AB27_9EURO|nr:uncharacterized protein PV07_12627 [Cladophialophora immunda]KIW21967.1 hypothetical protein PV07_12627 [Cladophialophora immunda]
MSNYYRAASLLKYTILQYTSSTSFEPEKKVASLAEVKPAHQPLPLVLANEQRSLPKATSIMEEGVSLNRDTVSSRLNPVSATVSKEDRHSWRTHYFQIFDKPFLRLWDHCSGIQPNGDGCMKSRAERERLDTFKSRKDSLTIHIDHKA